MHNIHSFPQTQDWLLQWDFWVVERKGEANAWSSGDLPDKYQNDKLSFTIPSARWQDTAVAQSRSHIPGLQDEGNQAQFPESFWTPDQTLLLGKI